MKTRNIGKKGLVELIIALCLLFVGCANGEATPEAKVEEGNNMDRKPVLAGSWYPGDSTELRATIESYFRKADPPKIEGRIVGMVSPHAGYVYSGPVAAYGFKALQRDKAKYKGSTVVIIGPNHRAAGFSGISIWADGGWITPLGRTPIDTDFAKALLNKLGPSADFNTYVHNVEHSLEIQLPFLQYALDNDLKIVPIVLGSQLDIMVDNLANAIAEIADEKTIILASTDLSHYHPQNKAQSLDGIFTEAVLSGDADSLRKVVRSGKCEACGYNAVLTLMKCAGRLGADSIEKLRYATSGDVPHGDSSQVVGYLAALFLDTGKEQKLGSNMKGSAQTDSQADFNLTDEQKIYLLKLARKTIEDYVRDGKVHAPKMPEDAILANDGAVFVTLHRDGLLRGCIGQMIAQGPLYLAVRDMAISAATRDHRFQPVSTKELDSIDIEISVLSPMQPFEDWRNFEMGVHGIWLTNGNRSGVFLPQVGRETGWSKERFLQELCSQKAGLRADCYKDPNTQLFKYTVVEFDEHDFKLR
jgi:AmmeMemoRadiSam system protein B/AmmeMemoRadiSam system protein A